MSCPETHVKRARDPGGPCEGEPVPHRVEVGGGANDGCGVGDAEGVHRQDALALTVIVAHLATARGAGRRPMMEGGRGGGT